MPRFKPLPDAPLHVFRNAPALFLGEGSHNGQDHFRQGVRRIDSFLLEEKLNTVALQFPDRLEGIHSVSGESANALRDNVIDRPSLAVLDHLLELYPAFYRSSAQAFVRINLYQIPVSTLRRPEPESLHLIFQAFKLGVLIRAHTAVCSNPLSACSLRLFNLRYCFHALLLFTTPLVIRSCTRSKSSGLTIGSWCSSM